MHPLHPCAYQATPRNPAIFSEYPQTTSPAYHIHDCPKLCLHLCLEFAIPCRMRAEMTSCTITDIGTKTAILATLMHIRPTTYLPIILSTPLFHLPYIHFEQSLLQHLNQSTSFLVHFQFPNCRYAPSLSLLHHAKAYTSRAPSAIFSGPQFESSRSSGCCEDIRQERPGAVENC